MSGFVGYVFQHSSAGIVQVTPNRANIASVGMQQGAGMTKVDEGVFESHLAMQEDAVPVP